MEVVGLLVGAKIVKGALTVLIDVLDDPDKPAKRKRYRVSPDRITQEDLKEFIGKMVTATILGSFIDDIWFG